MWTDSDCGRWMSTYFIHTGIPITDFHSGYDPSFQSGEIGDSEAIVLGECLKRSHLLVYD